jgi:FHA domain-containing protein
VLHKPVHTAPARRGPATGTLTARAVTGSVVAESTEGNTVRFGRNSHDVDVCVGGDDDQVSRQHGLLVCRSGTWWLHNTGRGMIELPNSQWLRPAEEPVPLRIGYTTVFVLGSRSRDHLLELYVAGADDDGPPPRHGAVTRPTRTWTLTARERLVLVALSQRYLLGDANPQPETRNQVATLLNDTQGTTEWTEKRVERVIGKVRMRLHRAGVAGLVREEVGEPIGNALSNNLIQELVRSMTLVPGDLELLEPTEN